MSPIDPVQPAPVTWSGEEIERVLDFMPDAVLLVRTDGSIAFANREAQALFGYDRQELAALRVDELLPERFRARHAAQRDGYARSPFTRRMGSGPDLRVLRKDGAEFPVEIGLNAVRDERGGLVVCCVRDVSERHAREAELRRLKERLEAETTYLRQVHEGDLEIVGESNAMRRLLQQVEQVAALDTAVLILGETGTGKELVARAVHRRGPRRDAPLVSVNCSSLTPSLIESELFGHERGAFTGAVGRRMGRFEVADGGTLFLDEVGDLPIELQPKLLRVLEEGTLERVGSSRTQKVDVRIISATHRDLEQEVEAGRFRADLFYRLSVFPIEAPPLRERPEDVPLLVWYFVDRKRQALGRPIPRISELSMQALQSCPWPGNVRELENVVERAMIRSQGETLEFSDLLPTAAQRDGAPPPLATLAEMERAHILSVLEACGWKVAGKGNAADRLGLKRGTLRARMKRLRIERP